MKFRIYIDEAGNSDLGSSDDPNHRFLSLTGAIIELEYVERTLHPQMENLKARYFGSHPDEPVILHRKEMLNAHFPFLTLRDESTRQRFNEELLRLLQEWDYTLLSVCIDKKKHKETYITWKYDPYHYCLAVMLERFVLFLERNNAKGDALAESRGGKEDIRLKAAFLHLWREGTEYISAERFQNVLSSKQLKVKSKANNIAGLQLADLLAHPSRNEILNEHGVLEKPLGVFAQKIIVILQRKYDRQGERFFGKKFL
ncbi:MAG: DUF3800 domain-containing protein [Candidatus Omnitrophota bacterium]